MNPSALVTNPAAVSSGTASVTSGSSVLSSGANQESPDALLVEVQGENSAYYKAYITDIFDGEVLLRFEDDWQPESKFQFNR